MERCFAAIAAGHPHADRKFAAAARLAPPGAAHEARKRIAEAKGNLTESEAKRVLAAYGVPVVEERLAKTVDEARAAARAFGYPVVMKAESPTILHKTELGVVKLGIADDAALARAYEEIEAAAEGRELRGGLAEPMLEGGGGCA